ncbi:MAG: thioredoxin family protein [Erythrobacter sp.]
MIRSGLAASLALALAACATTAPVVKAHGPQALLRYDAAADASGQVNAALVRAAEHGKRVLLVLGANWCHDSTALAGWLETPRFAALVAERYELVFVNVGMPQTGDGHNLGVARRFGLPELPGTPALLVLTPEGKAVNLDTAASWRNAASRSEDAIFAELAALADQPAP